MLAHFAESLALGAHREGLILQLMGGLLVTNGRRTVEVPEGCKRLLALVAIRGGCVERRPAAWGLWPEGSDARAQGNLRTALWRLKRAELHLLAVERNSVSLCNGVVVDTHLITDWSDRVLRGIATQADLMSPPLAADEFELLPGFSEEWVVFERERIRQRVLHALETASHRLSRLGKHAEAVDMAMSAVSAEPLRESSNRALIQAHLAEGNKAEALRCYHWYRDLSRRELGVEPALMMPRMVTGRE